MMKKIFLEQDNGEADIAYEDDLLLCPDDPQEPVQQENWQVLLGQVQEEQHLENMEKETMARKKCSIRAVTMTGKKIPGCWGFPK